VGLKRKLEAVVPFRPWVQPVVVIWGDFPHRKVERGGVAYVAGDALASWLREQPLKLSLRNQRLVRFALDAGDVAPLAQAVRPAARTDAR
jgi:hypothetical protein